VHLLMMNKNLRRQALEHPDVLQSFIRGQTVLWVPLKALGHEVIEVRVFISNNVVKGLSIRLAELTSRVLHHNGLELERVVVDVEELHLAL